MILLLHNRYRTLGGEERVVEDLAALLPQALGEDVEVLERGSAELSRSAAARGLLRGGLDPEEVGAAVRRTGARVVHAHNVQPAFGWRALQAARDAGARTVLTLHQYRLVCAVGTCLDPSGHDCTRCHGRDTRPGVRLNCRGGRADAAVYAAALARWSGRLVESADALTTPSAFTLARLQELGAPLGGRPVHVIANPVAPVSPELRASPATGTYAICSARLAPDKGVDVAIRACAAEGLPLVVTGHGPDEGELRSLAAALGADVRFAGRVPDAELAQLRAGAALAIVPSRFAETFGLSAAEAMAAGLPVAASRVGALTDLLPDADLARMGDSGALAAVARRLWGDAAVGERNAQFIAGHAAPGAVAEALGRVYDGPPERPAVRGTRAPDEFGPGQSVCPVGGGPRGRVPSCAMRALVTGGAGFIGSNLVDALVARGDDVTVIDDLSSGKRENLTGALSLGAKLVEADIRDAAAVRAAFDAASPQLVFHLAAQVDVRKSLEDPALDAAINVVGTINVLEAAREHAVHRFVNTSTGGAIYGETDVMPTPETVPPLPMAAYGQSKHAAELYCALMHRLYGLPTVTLRYGNVYGPRQDPHGEAGVIAIFAGRLLDGDAPAIFGDGTQTRDYTFVSDIVAANLAAAEHPDASGAYNVGTGVEKSVLDVLDALRGAAELPADEFQPEFKPARLGELERSSLDVSRARDELGFTAGTQLDAGMDAVLAALRAKRA